MIYTTTATGQTVILTITPDNNINRSNLYRMDLLLDQAVSSDHSLLIIDMQSISTLNAIGRWTIFQVACMAREHGKRIYLQNVRSSLRTMLTETGICDLAGIIQTNEELEQALSANPHGSGSDHASVIPEFLNGTVFDPQGGSLPGPQD